MGLAEVMVALGIASQASGVWSMPGKHHKDSRSCAVAAAYCLSEAGITLADVDEIAIAFNPAWPTPSDICTDAELIAELLDPALFDHHRPRQVTVVEHHLAHAASAFHPAASTRPPSWWSTAPATASPPPSPTAPPTD
ncbi:hypothetical protein [Streptomyces sp. SAS_270]|uniref:hypothetical protein n=1 Tax=Streptomyces sp. SAS_270 TaxID=3412748 RepID=UPI00403C910E